MRSFGVEHEGNIYSVDVTQKRVRTVTLRVMKDGKARMTVPWGFAEASVRSLLDGKAAWLSKSVEEAKALAEKVGPYSARADLPEMVEYAGKVLSLKVGYAPRAMAIEDGGELLLMVPQPNSAVKALASLDAWYEKKVLEKAMEYMEAFLPAMNVPPKGRPSLRVRSMRSRWGSYSAVTNTISINAALAKAEPDLLAYVMMHELAHLFHLDHQSGFKRFMDAHMPGWKSKRQELRSWARRQGPG